MLGLQQRSLGKSEMSESLSRKSCGNLTSASVVVSGSVMTVCVFVLAPSSQILNSVPRWLMVLLLMFPLAVKELYFGGKILSVPIPVSHSFYHFISLPRSLRLSPKPPTPPQLTQPLAYPSSPAPTCRSRNVKCYICMHINGAWRSLPDSDSSTVTRKVTTGGRGTELK